MALAERPASLEMPGVRRVQFSVSTASKAHSLELRERVLSVAEFNEVSPNYLVIPFINKQDRPEFDEEVQGPTAKLILEAFPGFIPDYVVGIGNSGLPLARAVNLELRANETSPEFIVATNLEDLEEEERPEGGFVFTAHSYSRQRPIKFHLPYLESGKTALVIDDVLAKGGISQEVIRQLLASGIHVKGFGVFFSKLWEGGVERIVNEFGIPVAMAIAIVKKEGEELTFVPDDETFVRYVREDAGRWRPNDMLDLTRTKYPSSSANDAAQRKS